MKFLWAFGLVFVCSLSVASPLPPLQVVRLLNKHSGKYIAVGQNHTGSGGIELVQQSKNDTPGQQWTTHPEPPSPGTSHPLPGFIFVSLTGEKAMGIRYQSSITGAPACLWPPGHGSTETFRLVPAEVGWVFLENYTSGKVLGVAGTATEDAKIVQWNKSTSDDRKWKLEPVEH